MGVPWPSPSAAVPAEPRQAAGCKNSFWGESPKPKAMVGPWRGWWGAHFWGDRGFLARVGCSAKGTGCSHHLGFLMALSVQGTPPSTQTSPSFRGAEGQVHPRSPGSAASRFLHLPRGCGICPSILPRIACWWGRSWGCSPSLCGGVSSGGGRGQGAAGTGWGLGVAGDSPPLLRRVGRSQPGCHVHGGLCHAGLSLFPGGYAASPTGS